VVSLLVQLNGWDESVELGRSEMGLSSSMVRKSNRGKQTDAVATAGTQHIPFTGRQYQTGLFVFFDTSREYYY
jgi:hypothetical protein